eukprot:SAG22_NODE_461_length_10216_cov_25.124543_5_plen_54_part_00
MQGLAIHQLGFERALEIKELSPQALVAQLRRHASVRTVVASIVQDYGNKPGTF